MAYTRPPFRLRIRDMGLFVSFRTFPGARVSVSNDGHSVAFAIAFPGAGRLQSGWIVVRLRVVSYVGIGVDSSLESQRVALPVFAGSWVVISIVVVMQSGLPIEDLAGEPQVVGDLRISPPSRREEFYDCIVTAELSDPQRSFRELVSECGIGAQIQKLVDRIGVPVECCIVQRRIPKIPAAINVCAVLGKSGDVL